MKKLISLLVLLSMVSSIAYAGKDLKTNYRTALVLAYSPTNSVYEDENVKFEIYNEQLWATNKTNKTIFIDLSQCFLVNNGSSYPMFEKETNEKKASKKKFSSSIDEFISIAPSTGSKQNETFICNLGRGLYHKYSSTESYSENFSEYEERMLTLINELVNESLEGDPKGKEYLGTAYRHLTEDESIHNLGVSLSYAFNKRSDEWNPVVLSTWVSDVYLAPFYVELPTELSKKEKRGFGVKKTEAAKIHIKADTPFEFDEDKSPVIVCDWKGDFKKGTFELSHTWVPKKSGMGFGKLLFASFATLATGGLGAALFTNIEDTAYKKAVIFDGSEDDWGKMSYMTNTDLSKFDNKR
ncbi:MAG: hypothetical protein K2M04_01925 [Muribaculaceae bacterium]|nr:hypothetical protein [Muribaculaceae bacterium]